MTDQAMDEARAIERTRDERGLLGIWAPFCVSAGEQQREVLPSQVALE